MQLIAAIGGLSFILASLITGARLLLVARRTRELPELALGVGLFLMGGLGYPMTLLAEFGTFLPDAARTGLVVTNTVSGVVGLTLFAFFTARVFRPESRGAQTSVWFIGLLFCIAFVYRATTYGFAPMALDGARPPLLHSLVTVVALGWAGAESLLYHARLRKRMRLGLTDPILVNRMWLWAQGMLAAMLLTGISSAFAVAEIPFNDTTSGILTIGIMGTLAAASIWFAFFPPGAYVRWIRSRAAAMTTAAA